MERRKYKRTQDGGTIKLRNSNTSIAVNIQTRSIAGDNMKTGMDAEKDNLVKKAEKSKNQKVLRYVKGPLMDKLNAAGEAAGIFMEQLERDAHKIKAKGLLKDFNEKDMQDLVRVLRG